MINERILFQSSQHPLDFISLSGKLLVINIFDEMKVPGQKKVRLDFASRTTGNLQETAHLSI